MSDSARSIGGKTPVNRRLNSAGWYPFGATGKKARWDGQAWTGESSDDPDAGAPAKWHRRPLPFLRHQWFWWIVIGWALTLALTAAQRPAGTRVFAQFAAVGVVLMMVGALLLIDRHLHFRQLPNPWLLVGCGVVSGLVAIVLATAIEGPLESRYLTYVIELYGLAGPIEETAKLLLPVLLLAFGGARFRDPRAGLLMVLVSGAVFGIAEARGYIVGGIAQGAYYPLVMGVGRPLAEMLHPFLTGFAAAVIWLAARRAGRVITLAGVVAWLIAIALHSVHDASLVGSKPTTTVRQELESSVPLTMNEALMLGAVTAGLALIWAILLFLLQRHSARELTPPDAIAANAPHWRPQLKQWGRAGGQDGEAGASQGADVGTARKT
jgi:hypothetical protein